MLDRFEEGNWKAAPRTRLNHGLIGDGDQAVIVHIPETSEIRCDLTAGSPYFWCSSKTTGNIDIVAPVYDPSTVQYDIIRVPIQWGPEFNVLPIE